MKKAKNNSGDRLPQKLQAGENMPGDANALQRRHFLKAIGVFGGSALLGQSIEASQKNAPTAVSRCAAVATGAEVLKPLGLSSVRVGGEIGRRIEVTINKNLLALDINEFILPFQKRDLRGEGYSDYIGLGKNIDAIVRFAEYSKSVKVLALKKHLIDAIVATQEADGYIGVMVKESRMWKLWDIHEMGYIIMGLTSDYHFFREEASLAAARKLAGYIIERWPTKPDSWKKWGQLGLESNMLALFQETKDKRYLDFCIHQLGLPEWKVDLDLNTLGKTHMYTDIDLCLAQLDLYDIQPDEGLLQSGRRAIEFLTARNGMSITGAAGLWESWSNDQGGRQYLGETCATAYQIRLLERFLRMEGSARYGDIIERIIYNALFGAQSPDGRQLRYFMPFEGDRVYFRHDTYCCPNNFRRIVSELPTIIYYRSEKGVAVNLYTSSEATIALNKNISLKIRQQTDYPSSGKVVISLDPSAPAKFSLQLRIPSWCDKATVNVNGRLWEGPVIPGQFFSLERQWSAGDQVSLDMSIPFRLVLGRRRQSAHVAIMRGPQVFCLNPAQNVALQKKDAADLTNFIIDPGSLSLLSDDLTIHPGGTACAVTMGDRLLTIGTPMQLRFNAFPDPDGKVIYFRIPDLNVAVPDEILSGNS